MTSYVTISPEEVLEFEAPDKKKFTKQTLAITNITDKPVAFKVRTTSPKVIALYDARS